jgi:hypothetical protein
MLGGFIMNLTLKQLFKFGAVCASACALSASATDYVSDSFEAPDGSLDLPVGEYKMVTSGAQNEITNLAWVAVSGDASTLVLTNAAYADYTATKGEGPITNEASELILNLETEGNILSRAVTNVLDITSQDVYIDTLIQFTPSEDEPVIDTADVKVALYVNAQSNLVVVSSMYDDPPNSYNPIETNSVIDLGYPIDPAKWYRLSMRVTFDAPDTLTDIYIDGVLITHANAYDISGAVNGGSSFLSIESQVADINFISFQGTGSLDELVVSDEMPTFPDAPVAITLTLVPGDGNVSFSPLGPVESGTEVTITAVDWYRIASVTGPINEDLSGAVGEASVVTTLTAAASCSVTATVAQVSGNLPIGGLNLDLSKLSTWALGQSLGEGDVDETNIDDYLLNVDVGTDATIEITSIVVDETAGTTTITVGADTLDVDFTDINGVLTVYTTTDLGVAFTETAKFVVELTPTAPEATLVITGISDEFIKAVVK